MQKHIIYIIKESEPDFFLDHNPPHLSLMIHRQVWKCQSLSEAPPDNTDLLQLQWGYFLIHTHPKLKMHLIHLTYRTSYLSLAYIKHAQNTLACVLSWASLVTQLVKNLPAMRETWAQSLDWEDPLEEGMATHSSILAWRLSMDRGAWWATVHGASKNQTLNTLRTHLLTVGQKSYNTKLLMSFTNTVLKEENRVVVWV